MRESKENTRSAEQFKTRKRFVLFKIKQLKNWFSEQKEISFSFDDINYALENTVLVGSEEDYVLEGFKFWAAQRGYVIKSNFKDNSELIRSLSIVDSDSILWGEFSNTLNEEKRENGWILFPFSWGLEGLK